MKKTCPGCSLSGNCGDDKLTYRQVASSLLLGILVTGLLIISMKMGVSAAGAEKCFTKEEVATATVTEKKCLTIYDGGVYDFTKAKKWDLTGHVGQHLCGKEYTKEEIENGPHLASKVMPMFKIGTLNCGSVAEVEEKKETGYWEGMSWFRLSAYLSLVFFLLNFLTCYAMPWAGVKEPWKGDFPGKDKKDSIGQFPLTHWHKIWAYLAVATLFWHGVLGFLRIFFAIYL